MAGRGGAWHVARVVEAARGRAEGEPWARRLGVALLALFCGAGLLNVFGQQPGTTVAEGGGARLEVDGPDRLRGGLMGQFRITVTSGHRLARPRLVLADGFLEETTINTITPEAADQGSEDGRLVLAYGPVAAGAPLVVRVQFQVNPNGVGSREQDVELRDGDTVLARVDRHLVVLP